MQSIMPTIEEQTRQAFNDFRRTNRALYRAIKEAEHKPSPEARVEVQRLLDAMLKKKRQFEELAIVRDAVWQNNYRQ